MSLPDPDFLDLHAKKTRLTVKVDYDHLRSFLSDIDGGVPGSRSRMPPSGRCSSR